MADIRGIVTEDRGLLKKIQAFLPGYKKYRNCEDLRIADSLLRKELATSLEIFERNVSDAREDLARRMDLENLNIIGELFNRSHKITEMVRHAEQGYAPWISGDVRIEEEELEKLYDFDLSLLVEVEELKKASRMLSESTNGNGSNVREQIGSLKNMVKRFEDVFGSRISTVTRVAQK